MSLNESSVVFRQDDDSDEWLPVEVLPSSSESPITIESSDTELDRPATPQEPTEDTVVKADILTDELRSTVQGITMSMMGNLLKKIPIFRDMSLAVRREMLDDIDDCILDAVYDELVKEK